MLGEEEGGGGGEAREEVIERGQRGTRVSTLQIKTTP